MQVEAKLSPPPKKESGTAHDLLVWDLGSRPEARELAIRVSVDLASLPWPSWVLRWSLDSG